MPRFALPLRRLRLAGERRKAALLGLSGGSPGATAVLSEAVRRFGGGELQFRALFEDDIFPDCAEVFDGLIGHCRRGGWLINRYELLMPPPDARG